MHVRAAPPSARPLRLRSLQRTTQDVVRLRCELRAATLAWPRQNDRFAEHYVTVFALHDAVGQHNRFIKVVCKWQAGERVVKPATLDKPLHFSAGLRTQRTQRFVEHQQARLMDGRARQRHPLPLTARQHRRPISSARSPRPT